MILEKLTSARSPSGALRVKASYRSQAGQAADQTVHTFTIEGASAQARLEQLQRLNETLEHVISITPEVERQR